MNTKTKSIKMNGANWKQTKIRAKGMRISNNKMEFAGLLLVLGVWLTMFNLTAVETRYLPTRADDSGVEVLRDLIKGLLVQSKMEQLEQQSPDLRFAQQELEQTYGRGLGVGSRQTRQVEVAQENSGDSEAAYLRSMQSGDGRGGGTGNRLLKGSTQPLD